MAEPVSIGVIGGSGKQGRGLALRWARAGHAVQVGSRSVERGEAAAAEYRAVLEGRGELRGSLTGGDNRSCLQGVDWAVLCVPYEAHAATLLSLHRALQGKKLIDLTVPLKPPKVSRVHLPPGESAAMEAKSIVGEGVSMVAALHHISALHLADLDHVFEGQVLVCGEGRALRDEAIGLIGDLGLEGMDAGVLDNAVALESLTPVLIAMNKRYGSRSAGLRIVGLPDPDGA